MKKLLTALSILLIATASYAQTYTVERVIDGDILKLTNGERVRLIGIDTPESKPNNKAKRDSKRTGKGLETITEMGKSAKKFMEARISSGRSSIRLEYDVKKRDKYGRLLAYVFYDDMRMMQFVMKPAWEYGTSSGLFLNAEIIKGGYATPMTFPPNVKYADVFKELYEEAREQERGLWSEESNLFLMDFKSGPIKIAIPMH